MKMMDTQDAIRNHIRKYCNRRGWTFADLSRHMGKDSRYVNSAVAKEYRNIGHARLLFFHQFIQFPAWIIEASEREQAERKVKRYAQQSQKQRGMRPGGKLLAFDRQPWPVTVRKLKAQPPVYARAW